MLHPSLERHLARARTAALSVLLGCAAGACSGSIEGDPSASPTGGGAATGGNNPAGGGGGAGAANGGNGGNGGGGAVGDEPGDPRIAQRIWRLSPEQLDREIAKLFGEGAPDLGVPQSAQESGLTNIAANAVIDQGNASIFADGIRAVASWVVEQGDGPTRCMPYGNDACVDTLLSWLPREAFRRPVAADELSALRGLFDDLSAQYEYDYAFAGVVRAVLLSPEFLYRTELNTVLTSFEIANALAYGITDEAPDDELIDAAENEDLASPDVREAQARRLMGKSEKIWQRFFWEWMHMSTLYSQGVEVGLSDQVVDQMEEEYRTFIREVIVNERGTLRDVLSAPYTWAQPELADHYGADHPGSGLQRIELDPTQRGGILTQGAWLVSHGKDGHDNVVRRGMSIYKDAMCNNNLRPPDGLDVLAELNKLVGDDATVREIVEVRGNAPACGGCHQVPDPMGMVFETFKSDGSWQENYPDGLPVDSDVTIMGLGSFDNARTLSEAFASDDTFQRCFVRRFTHFVAGIDLGSTATVAWSEQAHERLVATDGDLEEMLVAIVRHPAFIERRTDTEEAP
jgi:hypothetical protein